VLCVDVIDSVPKVAYREVLGDVILHETNISSVSWASAVLVNLVRVASARDGGLGLLGGFLLGGVGLRMRCGWRFQTRSNRQTATMNFASMQFERIIFPTYREVLGDIGLHETDISSVTGASSLLVSLVLVARVCVRERRSRREARSWGERRGESNEGHEEEDNFGEHCISVWYRNEYGWKGFHKVRILCYFGFWHSCSWSSRISYPHETLGLQSCRVFPVCSTLCGGLFFLFFCDDFEDFKLLTLVDR
jgi:hypothetical protein